MIKTIEVAPDMIAHGLANHIFREYGTVDSGFGYSYLCLYSGEEDDLAKVIKEYLTGPPTNQN